MRQQLITDGSFSEAEAMRLVRSLGDWRRERQHNCAPARAAAIAQTVEQQVIPRLLEACRPDRPETTQPAPQSAMTGAMTDQIGALTQLLLGGTQPQAQHFVEGVQASGATREQLFLSLFTPAARRLGTMWEEDDCSFADVTVGMGRLGNVVRLVSRAFEAETPLVQAGPAALLVQAPGEQHGLGIAMVASFFRRAGWNVRSEPVADSGALVSRVRQEWFSLVGLSVACTHHLQRLADDIRAIRIASRNPAIGIMVGGFAFIENPHFVQTVGADCTAADARLAVDQANALVSRLASPGLACAPLASRR